MMLVLCSDLQLCSLGSLRKCSTAGATAVDYRIAVNSLAWQALHYVCSRLELVAGGHDGPQFRDRSKEHVDATKRGSGAVWRSLCVQHRARAVDLLPIQLSTHYQGVQPNRGRKAVSAGTA